MQDSIRYIRELQQNYSDGGLSEYNLEYLISRRENQLKLTPKDKKRAIKRLTKGPAFKQVEKIYNQKLAKPFLESLSSEVQAKLKDVYIGILPTNLINANAKKISEDKSVIILHLQLMTAIGHYNEVQAIFGMEFEKNEDKAIEFLQRSYIEIINCYNSPAYLPRMSLLPPILKRNNIEITILKTIAQELFIIAHEYAHIYLNHFEVKSEEISVRQKLELEADVQAVKWLIEASNNKKKNLFKIFSPYLAVEVFMLFHLLEVNSNLYAVKYKDIFQNIKKDLTFEDHFLRFKNLITALDKLIDSNIADSNADHPSAELRLLNICANLLFDETGQKFLNDMIYNLLFYETFKIKA